MPEKQDNVEYSFKMVLNQIFCSAIMEKQYRVHLNFMTYRFL